MVKTAADAMMQKKEEFHSSREEDVPWYNKRNCILILPSISFILYSVYSYESIHIRYVPAIHLPGEINHHSKRFAPTAGASICLRVYSHSSNLHDHVMLQYTAS